MNHKALTKVDSFTGYLQRKHREPSVTFIRALRPVETWEGEPLQGILLESEVYGPVRSAKVSDFYSRMLFIQSKHVLMKLAKLSSSKMSNPANE